MRHEFRIAIAQPTMYWTTEENAGHILNSLAIAASQHAHVCVFPELAITGFHRQIKREATAEIVSHALARVRATCKTLRIAAVIGAPTFKDAHIFNSALFIDENGNDQAAIEKIGITSVEATFFARGTQRAVAELRGFRCTAILCREVHDLDDLKTQIQPHSVDLIFWPGIMRPDPQKTDQTEDHICDASTLAQHTNAYVVQSNWPMSLNYPEETNESGHSVVISPNGDTLFRLPKAQAGIGVFNLGDRRYDWIPE
jgi:omega-amidase